MRMRAKQEDAVNRSFRQRVGALAGVLLAGTIVLAWVSPASAVHQFGSTATLGTDPGAVTVVCGAPSAARSQFGTDTVAGGGTVSGTAQCGANVASETVNSTAAQVVGTYTVGGVETTFELRCTYANREGVVVTTFQKIVNGQIVDQGAALNTSLGMQTLQIGGVTVASVNCLAPAAHDYPLAVGASGASEAAGPALVTQPAATDDSSGRGTTWLLLAGAAALLVVAGQLAMGRRIGRRGSQATD